MDILNQFVAKYFGGLGGLTETTDRSARFFGIEGVEAVLTPSSESKHAVEEISVAIHNDYFRLRGAFAKMTEKIRD